MIDSLRRWLLQLLPDPDWQAHQRELAELRCTLEASRINARVAYRAAFQAVQQVRAETWAEAAQELAFFFDAIEAPDEVELRRRFAQRAAGETPVDLPAMKRWAAGRAS